MPKIVVLKGLPGSGKTTLARKFIKEDGNMVRVNKDCLREMMFFSEWSGIREGMVLKIQARVVEALLRSNKNVVIDDTNLNPKHIERWKQMATEGFHHFEVVTCHTDIWECIARDSKRERPIGADTIINMANEAGLWEQKRPIVICDIDGTLADIEHRKHFVAPQTTSNLEGQTSMTKNWTSFFEAMEHDTLRADVLQTLREFSGHDIILVSGRPEDYRKATTDWLLKHNVGYDRLIMRKKKDTRPDDIVKREILQRYIDKSKVAVVIDDRPSVIRMWKDEGLEVIDVGDGVEF